MTLYRRSSRIVITPKLWSKYFFYYPQLLVVIGLKHKGKVNFMPVAWSTALSYAPFIYGVAIGNDRHSHKMISRSKSFTVNFVSYSHVHLVRSLGRSTGAEIDKVKKFRIKYSNAQKVDSPILNLSYCTFECIKTGKYMFGDHTFFIGKVALIDFDAGVFDNAGLINTAKVAPLLYCGIDDYITTNNKTRISMKNLPFYYKERKRVKIEEQK
ncbi:MAG: flavin reductase family protein [Candidatus Omnitrophica bacterium]|nr:flavin reductase family protein [Candidatus Omnitrophota bacterium]